MKKCIACVCAAATLFACGWILGCGGENLSMDGHDWQFTVLLSDEDGSAICCSEEVSAKYSGARVAKISCSAGEGKLTLTYEDSGETLEFVCTQTSASRQSVIYALEGDAEGIASVSMTSYADGVSEYTLVVSAEGRSAWFTDKS